MARTEEQQISFMHNMLDSYAKVHNDRYWQEITDLIKDKAKGVVLDIGCGPGLLLKELGQKFSPNNLIGVDLSQIMLDKAEEILRRDLPNIPRKLIFQHMQENPILPSNIDVIFSSRVLRSFDDQVSIFSAIHSSLNDDGLIVILDWDRASLPHYVSYFNKDPDRFAQELSEMIRLHRNFSRYSLEDWVFILENTGFEVVKSFQVNPVHICIIGRKLKK